MLINNLYSILAKNQLELIFEVIGTPTDEEINKIPKEKFRKMIKAMPKRTGKSFDKIFTKASPEGKNIHFSSMRVFFKTQKILTPYDMLL